MRFLLRNGIFILFPAVVVAIIFLATISFGSAVRFGEWGERSIAESTLIVTREKIERVEEIIRTTDDTFFRIIDPARLDTACERWQSALHSSSLVEGAAIIDDFGDIAAFFYRDSDPAAVHRLRDLTAAEVVPLLDKYESLDQYKHVHRLIGDEYRLITHFTTLYGNWDYTALLLYDTEEIVKNLLADLLDNIGSDRVANVVDDHNRVILGRKIDHRGQFIVARRFPSTFYKWQLQLAPTAKASFSSRAKARAQYFSNVMLIPLALAIIAFGLVVLYLSVVRERRVSRLKSDFIANVSHELKTPLSLIRMFSELLLISKTRAKTKDEGSREEDKAGRYAEVIIRETDRLGSLIDNVLDLARIERAKSMYTLEMGDITEAVERGVEAFRPRLDALGIPFTYDVAPGLPMVKVDGHAITLAIVNLLDNAAKYAEGTDLIGLSLYQQGGMIHIDVFDRGAGIPAKHIKRVFERFHRVPSEKTRKQRGSGIGLSLVEHIAVAHGGTVLVSSKPRIETRFSIRIPAS
ncbi:MAG: HAMP domain-containing sensor histidine kinase [Myxococcota bacterium]|nr:HAMP domain-containing sensor histidine kinase [Myxococcota bacterium]